MILKEFLSSLSSCNVVAVYAANHVAKGLYVLLTGNEPEVQNCIDLYGSCVVASWFVHINQVEVYIHESIRQ